jgi:uncharacterized protein (DUF1800 family)
LALSTKDLDAAIAATRFGLGARPGEIATAASDPRGWLKAQIRKDGADRFQSNGQTAPQRIADLRDFQRERQQERRANAGQPADAGADAAKPAKDPRDPVKMAQRILREDTAGDFLGRTQLAATTDAGFRERWALFWANHFTVAAKNLQTATIVGPYENEAIRPHVFGDFTGLLMAAETHPAMLIYLDQVQSVGPDSQMAQGAARRGVGFGARLQPVANRKAGLNENLAREIMELHTVGVHGGYTQADVTEFARAMTGLSVAGPRDAVEPGTPVFRSFAHEPGARTVMGVRYDAGEREQVATILGDLAAKPQTAQFICAKIARHFVADDPPPSLVAGLKAVWMASNGDLGRVAQALIDAPEAWDPRPRKFKTPYEFVVSSYRAAGLSPQAPPQVIPILTGMGQKPFDPGSPKGWAEEADAWASPDGVIKRLQFAQAFTGAATQGRDPNDLARQALGGRMTAPTAAAIAKAETRPEGFALLLMSPEFQRR